MVLGFELAVLTALSVTMIPQQDSLAAWSLEAFPVTPVYSVLFLVISFPLHCFYQIWGLGGGMELICLVIFTCSVLIIFCLL